MRYMRQASPPRDRFWGRPRVDPVDEDRRRTLETQLVRLVDGADEHKVDRMLGLLDPGEGLTQPSLRQRPVGAVRDVEQRHLHMAQPTAA